MKTIKVKSLIKPISEDIKLDGDAGSWNGKLKKRIVDCLRTAKEARKAAKLAEEQGDPASAAWLNDKATELEEMAKNWNRDIIQSDDEDNKSSENDGNKENKTPAEEAKDAAEEASAAAQQAENAASRAKKAASKQAKNGQDNGEAQAQADEAKANAEKAKEAAKEAKQHADAAKEAEQSGNEDVAKQEAKEAKQAANEAKQAAKDANSAANKAEGKDDKSNSDENGSGEDESSSDNNQSNNKQNSSSNSDSSDGDDSEEDGGSSSGSADQDQKGKKSKSNGSSSGSQSQSQDQDDSDDDQDQNQNGNGNGQGQQDQQDKDDDNDNDGNSDEAPQDPFADDEDIPQLPKPGQQQDSKPREATLDEIIKHLQSLEGDAKRGAVDGLKDLIAKGSKNESLHEDLEMDKVKAIAKKYGAELKYHQGAFGLDYEICIDSRDKEDYKNCYDELQAMNPTKLEKTPGSIIVSWAKERKVSYFFEAVRSIRSYSDEEFDEMIDEVIDKILEINKKVKVVDDLAGIDAEFDQLDKDPYARDELEKELKNNIRVDVLKRRREKQDNSKYTQYAGLKNFKLDFENAIKEAVDDVIETIKSYKEIDPYSEGEDIITKADVKQLIPDEKIPIIALFFDQSGSWPKHYANLGKKAISTLVTDYEQQGLIELHIYYFDDDVTQDENDPSLRNGTTEAWDNILDEIIKIHATNVVIMTDSDMDSRSRTHNSYDSNRTVTVEGNVWWIWKAGDAASNCARCLTGLRGNYQYTFTGTENMDD